MAKRVWGFASAPAGLPQGIWTNKKGLALALCVLAAPGWAEMRVSCAMERECLIDESCTETDFAFEIEGAAPLALRNEAQGIEVTVTVAQFVSDAETVQGVIGKAQEDAAFPMTFVSLPGQSPRLLSVAEDGAAQLAVLMPEQEFALTYLGRCEALE